MVFSEEPNREVYEFLRDYIEFRIGRLDAKTGGVTSKGGVSG